MGTWYAAVEDDPLTSGPGGRVYATGKVGTVKGDDGRHRRMAFLGDRAYCAACGSVGLIACGTTGLREQRCLLDRTSGGRRQAVGDDIVLCKCPTPPRIIARYGRKWKITEQGVPPKADEPLMPMPVANHWIGFTLTDQGAHGGLKCVAHFADGSSEHGTFNANNTVRFERVNNDNACTCVELKLGESTPPTGSVAQSILSVIAG